MTSSETVRSNILNSLGRVIGSVNSESVGPCVVFVGGLHGNEPSGVIAIDKVLRQLSSHKKNLRGNVYGLSGNLKALKMNVRFVEKDLNRIWKPQKANGNPIPYEDEEKQGIIDELETIINSTNEPIYLFDLHTTSSESIPFVVLGDSLRNRKLGRNLPVPIILGLEEKMDGTLFSFLNTVGFSTLIFESGQHDDPESIYNHEAFIWVMLSKLGVLNGQFKYDVQTYKERLAAQSGSRARYFEVKHRYHIHDGEEFRMNPGYDNFQNINKGEDLARSGNEQIFAIQSGKILLPLYQPLGEDGFMIVRKVMKIWLFISWLLRLSRLEFLLYILPGVKRGSKSNIITINQKIARIYPVEIFHLFGFRRIKKVENLIEVSKRDFDIYPPTGKQVRQRFLATK